MIIGFSSSAECWQRITTSSCPRLLEGSTGRPLSAMLHPAASAPHWDGLFGVIASRWQAASGDAPQELTDDSRRLKFVFREYCFYSAATSPYRFSERVPG